MDMTRSTTDAVMNTGGTALDRLEGAIRAVLGAGFEDGMRALVEARPWYASTLPVREVFRLWVFESLSSADDPLWVFQPVRAGERKYLCDKLGIDRASIVGLSPRSVADLVLRTAGLPSSTITGLATERTSWQAAVELTEGSEDERAAILLRQLAEALLRRMLHFYCAAGYGGTVVAIIREPGSLRLPKKLDALVKGSELNVSAADLAQALAAEDVGDLGFLALALRKLSSRLEHDGAQHISGDTLIVFRQAEFDAFLTLATALQAYTHHKPSMEASRKDQLAMASRGVLGAVEGMIKRNRSPRRPGRMWCS